MRAMNNSFWNKCKGSLCGLYWSNLSFFNILCFFIGKNKKIRFNFEKTINLWYFGHDCQGLTFFLKPIDWSRTNSTKNLKAFKPFTWHVNVNLWRNASLKNSKNVLTHHSCPPSPPSRSSCLQKLNSYHSYQVIWKNVTFYESSIVFDATEELN